MEPNLFGLTSKIKKNWTQKSKLTQFVYPILSYPKFFFQIFFWPKIILTQIFLTDFVCPPSLFDPNIIWNPTKNMLTIFSLDPNFLLAPKYLSIENFERVTSSLACFWNIYHIVSGWLYVQYFIVYSHVGKLFLQSLVYAICHNY